MERATRLEDFTKVFKSYPLTDENFENFYVDTSSVRVSDEIKALAFACRLDASSYDKFLFSGHMGSGKSTEMYKLVQELQNDFEVIHVPLMRDLDISSIGYIDLIFEIMSVVVERIDSKADCIENIDTLDELYRYWNAEHFREELGIAEDSSLVEIQSSIAAEGSVSAKVPGLKAKFIAKIAATGKSIFKNSTETKEVLKKKIEPKIGELINALNDILLQLNSSTDIKPLLLIVEDLDKADIADVEKIFVQHRQKFLNLKIKSIFMIPIYLEYSAGFKIAKDSFTEDYVLSTIGLVDRDELPIDANVQFYQKFVEKRADIQLIDSIALKFMIIKSGGILRDLFRMLSGASIQALISSHDRIEESDAQMAYRKLKDGYISCISSKEENDRILDIYRNSTQAHTDEIMTKLLSTNTIIECCDANGRYCVVHPTVVDFFKMQGDIDE